MAKLTRMAVAARSGAEVRAGSEHDRFPLAGSLRRARVTAKPSGRGASCGVPVQQAAPPPPGAACCRPGDGDGRPALTGHQQSPQVRQRVVLRCGRSAGGTARQRSPAPRLRGVGVTRQQHRQPGTVTDTAHGTNPADRADVRLRGRCALAPPSSPARGRHRSRRTGLGSPVRVTGAAHQGSRRGHRRDSARSLK